MKSDLRKEDFVDYFGSKEKINKQIHQCRHCGSKLLLTHLPDYGKLYVQETSRCLDCGEVHKKRLHILN